MKCLEQYVTSTINFKSRFQIHDCRHFNKYCHSSNPFIYLHVQTTEKMDFTYEGYNIEDILWDRDLKGATKL